MASGDIIVVPHFQPGHLFPATELCLRLAERNFSVTFFVPSASSSSSVSMHPLIKTIDPPIPNLIRIDPSFLESTLPNFISEFLADRRARSSLPLCAIVDKMIGWIATTFLEFGVPSISFFTSSAISSALEHAVSQINPATDPIPTAVPGLPDHVSITAFDIAQKDYRRAPRLTVAGDQTAGTAGE